MTSDTRRVMAPLMFGCLMSGAVAYAADMPDHCTVDGVRRIPDKLEAFIQSGIGLAPFCGDESCCVNQKFHHIKITKRGEPSSVWVRAVRFDELDVGLPNKAISVSIVDAFGRAVAGVNPEVDIRNGNVITDVKGFGYLPVVVSFTNNAPIGKVYRLRFAYADSLSISYSYGPHFYVTDAEVTGDLRDYLLMSGYSIQE